MIIWTVCHLLRSISLHSSLNGIRWKWRTCDGCVCPLPSAASIHSHRCLLRCFASQSPPVRCAGRSGEGKGRYEWWKLASDLPSPLSPAPRPVSHLWLDPDRSGGCSGYDVMNCEKSGNHQWPRGEHTVVTTSFGTERIEIEWSGHILISP